MSKNIPEDLKDYRQQIDAIDQELITLLARRYEIVRAVGALKARENLSVIQHERAEHVKQKACELASQKGLSPDLVRKIYETMIDYAHELEHEIIENTHRQA
ncbi:MAG: chorismate mutase [Alphaproteobacteria bacterium]|nr:chorismate mutase [Alphaproteobacteria bacterium]